LGFVCRPDPPRGSVHDEGDGRTPPAFNPEKPATRGTLLASAALTIMAGATIAPSLPAMREVFVGTPGAEVLVRLVLTITALAIALTAPLAGVFADRVGRRPCSSRRWSCTRWPDRPRTS
jgi:MFS family permease